MKNTRDGTGILRVDPWLEPYSDRIRLRQGRYVDKLKEINKSIGSVKEMALGYRWLGFNKGECKGKKGVWYREWAPAALGLFLIGDFNYWDRAKHPMKKDENGVWSIFVEDNDNGLRHGQNIKVHVVTKNNQEDRIPAYVKRVEKDESGRSFTGVYWDPKAYKWKHQVPEMPKNLRIYEAHIGMAQEDEKIGSFLEFKDKVLIRIKNTGYNAIQLMAIAHHPYYASFGYQVGNFFAVSSYFGTPEELKELIDEAHGLGLVVFMDLIHSHAVKNTQDGLNKFDGSDHQYFHAGSKGEHPAWDTKLFDYGKFEVMRFLLSNARYWLEEYRFDGFRMDGVTSMIYLDHGLGRTFNHYQQYFDTNVDEDALVYLKLFNKLVKEIKADGVTIAEEVSGMPGLALPIEMGGVGFDYRLAMGIPDNWIKMLKHKRDDEWRMDEIFEFLRNRRQSEKHVAYAESHDQALVGDKTIAFWLMDKAMYWNMEKTTSDLVIDRGLALHKMIRLITFGLGGEAYLNFMGNEFGHPEWIDFPRDGNYHSFKYARRQWSLVDNPLLRYQFLHEFDKALHRLDEKWKLLGNELIELLYHDNDEKVIIFRRGELVWVFNFHPERSYTDYRIGVPDETDYQIELTTDMEMFGGFDRVINSTVYPLQKKSYHHRSHSLQIYLPSRTAQVLSPKT